MGIKRKKNIWDVVVMLLLIGAAALCLIPILNTVAISLSDKTSAGSGQVFIWPLVDGKLGITLLPYEDMLSNTEFFRAFWVSVQRVVLGAAINVVLTILTAYPLSKSREQFRLKNIYMWFVVFLMLFNGGMIPTFIVVSRLKLIDTIWSMVLPGAVPVFNVIVLMNFYKAIPRSLEEAAMIDGAGPWRTMLRIYVPLAKASIAVVALWSIVGHWNDFYAGRVYINERTMWPLQTYIQNLTTNIDPTQFYSMTPDEIQRMMQVSNLTFTAAKIVVSMIPILVIYPLLQKFFVTGIVMGAVKE
jgi:putative aldouronate transport system permease protein